MTYSTTILLVTLFVALAANPVEAQPTPAAKPARTEVVLLGTGNPPADPGRLGPATAVIVKGTPCLVDFGAGVIRRAKSAVVDRGVTALEPMKLRVVFRHRSDAGAH